MATQKCASYDPMCNCDACEADRAELPQDQRWKSSYQVSVKPIPDFPEGKQVYVCVARNGYQLYPHEARYLRDLLIAADLGQDPVAPVQTKVEGWIMTKLERARLEAILRVLESPRDRYRRPEVSLENASNLREIFLACDPPNGGLDNLDQCTMVLQHMLGFQMQDNLQRHPR